MYRKLQRKRWNSSLGTQKYYLVLVWTAIICQCLYLGVIGIIFCASSLLSSILTMVLLPVTEILAVIFYKENFQAEKGVALPLSLWGFVSHFYSELKHSKIRKQTPELESVMPQIPNLWQSLVFASRKYRSIHLEF